MSHKTRKKDAGDEKGKKRGRYIRKKSPIRGTRDHEGEGGKNNQKIYNERRNVTEGGETAPLVPKKKGP